MVRLFFSVLLMLLAPLSLQAFAATTKHETVLVLGDSISAGFGLQKHQSWPALLSTQLANSRPKIKIVNASINGETTAGGLQRLTPLLEKHRPVVVVLELGGNDGLQGQPLAAIQSRLSQLIETCQKAQAKVLLVGMRLPSNYGKAYTDGFAQLYVDLAKQYKVELIPFFFENIMDQPNMFQGDRIHPTEKAQPILKDRIWRSLAPMLGTQKNASNRIR